MRLSGIKVNINYTVRQPAVLYSLLFLLVALVLLTVSLIIWYPVNSQYVESNRLKLIEKNKYLTLLKLSRLATTYTKAKKNSEFLKSKLLHGMTQSTIINNLAKITSSNHLSVKKESYKEIKLDYHVLLQHNIIVTGQYKDIKKMIHDIQSLPYLTYIKREKFEKLPKSGHIKARLAVISFLRFKNDSE